MMISIPRSLLQALLGEAAELGAVRALVEVGSLKPYLSKNQACKKYGQAEVERWVREGLLTPLKDGNNTSKWRIDRVQLETVAKANNRKNYALITQQS